MNLGPSRVRWFLALAAALVGAVGHANEHAKQIPSAMAALQGRWQLVPPPGFDSDPKAADDPELEKAPNLLDRVFILRGNRLTWEGGGPTRFDEAAKRGDVTVMTSPKAGPTLYEQLRASAAERNMPDDYATDMPGQVMIGIPFFKLVGLYRIDDKGRMDLILRYLGQGVEGEFARKWRPPMGFGENEPDDCLRLQMQPLPSGDQTRSETHP